MPKTINDIIPPSRRRQMEAEAGMPPPPPTSYDAPSEYSRPRRKFPWGLVIAVVVILVVSIGALYAFAGARVQITPTTGDATITGDFTATAATGELPFEIASVDKVATQNVKAESTETVNDAAQGTITVSNTSGEVQQFVKNTRFETPEGLIFKAQEPITIPAGVGGAPGTAKITVYAESGGDKYNVDPTTFTLPGLAGSDLGAFSGTRPSVSQATRDKQYPALETALARDLEAAISEQIPEGYVMVPGSVFYSYVPQPDTSSAAGSVEVRLKGTASAVIFPETELAEAIAYKSLGVYGGEPVTLKSVDGLVLTASSSPAGNEFFFGLSGETTIIWLVDTERIAGAVAGKKRDAAQVILAGFPEVERAVLVLRPFWAGSFPADPSEITVTVTEEGAAK